VPDGNCGTLAGNPTLKVKPVGQRGRWPYESGRNSNEAVASAASEAFAMWLHRRCASVELQSAAGHIVSCFLAYCCAFVAVI